MDLLQIKVDTYQRDSVMVVSISSAPDLFLKYLRYDEPKTYLVQLSRRYRDDVINKPDILVPRPLSSLREES